MPDTLDIPENLPTPDRNRMKRVNRNIRIRKCYPELCDEHGRAAALEILAERHGISPASVREIVYERR